VYLAKKCWAMEDAHMWNPSSSSSSSKLFYCTKNHWRFFLEKELRASSAVLNIWSPPH
jgi:hypothetical protein